MSAVSCWSELPLCPKVILPKPSRPKHMEKEFEVNPLLDKMLGTDIFSMPSPNKPLGAALRRNEPVWTTPQLQDSTDRKLPTQLASLSLNWLCFLKATYPNTIGASTTRAVASSIVRYRMSSTRTPEDEVFSDKYWTM